MNENLSCIVSPALTRTSLLSFVISSINYLTKIELIEWWDGDDRPVPSPESSSVRRCLDPDISRIAPAGYRMLRV